MKPYAYITEKYNRAIHVINGTCDAQVIDEQVLVLASSKTQGQDTRAR